MQRFKSIVLFIVFFSAILSTVSAEENTKDTTITNRSIDKKLNTLSNEIAKQAKQIEEQKYIYKSLLNDLQKISNINNFDRDKITLIDHVKSIDRTINVLSWVIAIITFFFTIVVTGFLWYIENRNFRKDKERKDWFQGNLEKLERQHAATFRQIENNFSTIDTLRNRLEAIFKDETKKIASDIDEYKELLYQRAASFIEPVQHNLNLSETVKWEFVQKMEPTLRKITENGDILQLMGIANKFLTLNLALASIRSNDEVKIYDGLGILHEKFEAKEVPRNVWEICKIQINSRIIEKQSTKIMLEKAANKFNWPYRLSMKKSDV